MELHNISESLILAASNGDAQHLTDLLEKQKEFVLANANDLDDNAKAALFESLTRVIRAAKIRRAQLIDTIASNQRSLGVLQGYLAAQDYE